MIAVALAAAVWAAGPSVTLEPQAVRQGSWAVLRVPAAAAKGTVEALGRVLPLFPGDGGLRALIPVPLTTAPGRRAILIRVRGREYTASLRVVRRGAPPKQVLTSLKVTAETAVALRSNKAVLGTVLRVVTPEARWSGPFRRPAPGRISAEFGAPRAYGGTGAGWPHRGLDFAPGRGWPVVASGPGTVALSRKLPEYGNIVVLDHGQTVFTAYLHMMAREVNEGARVAEGQVIGTVGATGFATGPHLHFAVYIAGVAVDPAELLERGLP